MSLAALSFMLITWTGVIVLTVFCFIKLMKG